MLSRHVTFDRCPHCRELKYKNTLHSCPPRFYVSLREDLDSFNPAVLSEGWVYSADSKTAVEKFVRQFDCDTDYDIAGSDHEYEALVLTHDEYMAIDFELDDHPDFREGDQGERFCVTGEYVPSYSVNSKKKVES